MQQQLKPGGVFLSTLTHNGQLDYLMAKAFYLTPTRERAVFWVPKQTSLLAAGMNHLWCQALNVAQEHDLKWFAMLHSDICPEDFWIDKLIAEAEKHDADVMSAVVPIKDNHGITSTAISGIDEYNRFTRISMKQIWSPIMPETFSIGTLKLTGFEGMSLKQVKEDTTRLLINTGCFVARLDREWCPRVHFTINDRITTQLGGQLLAEVESEDWFFSRRVAEEGGKVMATRVVRLDHMGGRAYKSTEIWGEPVDHATQF